MEGTKRQGGRRPALIMTLLAASAWLTAPSAAAFEFNLSDDDIGWGDWGQVSFTWNTRLTAGAQVRTEHRDDRLIDIHNVPGQETLCAERTPEVLLTGLTGGGDCQARFGEVGAIQIIPNARGGININGDDGNLNYDRGDVTYANFQARSELTAFWRNFTFKVSGLGYYDPVNNDFETHSADIELPNRLLSGEVITLDRNEQRRDDLEDLLGEELRLLEAFVAADFNVAGRNLRVAVGDQTLRWGESTFMIFNNLARINPPSARLYDRPGTEVRDAFLPVGMVTASMNGDHRLQRGGVLAVRLGAGGAVGLRQLPLGKRCRRLRRRTDARLSRSRPIPGRPEPELHHERRGLHPRPEQPHRVLARRGLRLPG